jgi:hypothetical protein
MLGWLILFSFLTGAFVGSTTLMMIILFLYKDPETVRNLEEHEKRATEEYKDYRSTSKKGNILKYN